MNLSRRSPADMLDRQLRDARMRAFVGRDQELAVFQAALTDRTRAFTVIYFYGPGGIGKSTLLVRLADEAQEYGRDVIFLNPSQDRPSPDRLSRDGLLRDHRPAAAVQPADEAPAVVLIDGFDALEHPERWLRDTVLPSFPSGTLIVVASRRPPSVDWRADLGWSDILRPRAVHPLSPAESAAMLSAHGLSDELQAGALAFGCGNPLALRVAAQTVVADDKPVADEDLHRNLALSIFDPLIGEIPSPAHRQALEVCAHAATTDEDLLRAAVPGSDAAQLFAWLRDRPFVTSGPRGLSPSDVVRNVVETELRWRDADSYSAMHSRVKAHLIRRVRTTAADVVLPFVADVIFVQRGESRRSFITRLSGFEVQEHHYRPADLPQVLELARQSEGAESARMVEYWLGRQPEAFYVYRRQGDPTVIAFFCWLTISHLNDEEIKTDPVVAAAWNEVRAVMPLRPGEHLGISRFSVDPASYHRPSQIMDLMQLRVAARIICDDDLAWSVVASADPDFWSPTLERSHRRNDGPPVVVGGRAYTLYSQHFGAMPISAWSQIDDDLMLSRRSKPTPIAQNGAAWTRTEFDQEVRQTLRSWRRPDLLADGRMVRSRMVAEAGGDDPVAGLRRIFSDALATLRGDPRQAKYHRVLMATFIEGAPTQEAAAERLNLPFSTYRRHLGRGLDGLCALLWKVETHGLSLLDAAEAPGRGR